MSTNPGVGEGYVCGCGTWVPFGVHHTCPANQWVMPEHITYTTTSMDNAILERIAKALERIAETIDR